MEELSSWSDVVTGDMLVAGDRNFVKFFVSMRQKFDPLDPAVG